MTRRMFLLFIYIQKCIKKCINFDKKSLILNCFWRLSQTATHKETCLIYDKQAVYIPIEFCFALLRQQMTSLKIHFCLSMKFLLWTLTLNLTWGWRHGRPPSALHKQAPPSQLFYKEKKHTLFLFLIKTKHFLIIKNGWRSSSSKFS